MKGLFQSFDVPEFKEFYLYLYLPPFIDSPF